MDTLTFSAKLFEALAWPITSVALVLLLRAELRSLVPWLKRVKLGPVEAEFERTLQEVQAATVHALPGPKKVAELPSQRRLLALANHAPRTAILESWRILEAQALETLRKRSVAGQYAGNVPILEAMRLLQELDVLTLEETSALNQLRFLNNQTADITELEPTPQAARDYIELSARLYTKLGEPHSNDG